MAFSSLLTLLDDIVSVLDDVALMTKVAAKKTAGVVGDDLALNANQVTGVRADRELPIVWAVAKGSLVNKLILIPAALLLSVFAPALITPLLMFGGGFLCFEGVEKLLHKFLHRHDAAERTVPDEIVDEGAKIKGAIRTDFILSAEIVIIALGVVAESSLTTQIVTLLLVGIGLTVLVYGVVALIVKTDDFGLALMRRPATAAAGKAIILFMPWFMRGISVVGTLAMFLVGGGIFAHNWGALHQWLHARHWDSGLSGSLASLLVGLAVGMLACAVVLPLMKLWAKRERD